MASYDAVALRRLVDHYALAADRHDGAALAALFIEDGRLLIHQGSDPSAEPIRRRTGRAEIAAAIETLVRYRRTFHLVGQHVAELVDDDHATAVTYCQAHHVTAGDDGPATDHVMMIRYLDDYVRAAGEWRFATRRLLVDWTATHPVD